MLHAFNPYPHVSAQALPKLAAVQDAMTRYFAAQSSRAGLGLELLPGVQKLLETLKARDPLFVCRHPLQVLLAEAIRLSRCVGPAALC